MSVGGWFYEVEGGERRGPLSLSELQQLVQTNIVKRETRVFAEGMQQPVLAGTLPVLFPPGPEPWLRWLLPVGRSGWAIAVGYLGFLSFFPFFGYITILLSILAIGDLRKHRNKSGWGRVIFGLVVAIPMSILYTVMFLKK